MARVKAGNDNDSVWQDGFLFLGNQLVLDFLNTRPVQNDEPQELLPDFAALLRWFQTARLVNSREAMSLQRQWGQSVQAQRTVEDVRAQREKLRTWILAWEREGAVRHSTVDELNRLMAEHPMRTRLRENGNALSTQLYFEPRKPEDLLAPLVHGAATLFSGVDRTRVRKCDQCVLHFHDISKKGTRRWCSMQLCGNRLKVAAYAARNRSAHRDVR